MTCKPDCLKNTNSLSYSSIGQKSDKGLHRLQNEDISRAALLPGGSRGSSIFLSFPAFRRHQHSLAHGCPLSSSQLGRADQILLQPSLSLSTAWKSSPHLRTGGIRQDPSG